MPEVQIIDLRPEDRPLAMPVLLESFTGIYRWHAKRTLREVSRVSALFLDGRIVGWIMLELLNPAAGYVYYVAVGREHRGRGYAGRLLDHAIESFRSARVEVVYAAAESDNIASVSLFRSRGFREVGRKELSYQEGGLGAWGLRSRMRVVAGEVLLGIRLRGSDRGDLPVGDD